MTHDQVLLRRPEIQAELRARAFAKGTDRRDTTGHEQSAQVNLDR
jgi:hypothetical protein